MRLQTAVAEILRTLNLPHLEAFGTSLHRPSFGGENISRPSRTSFSLPSGPSPPKVSGTTPGSGSERLPGVRFLSELPSPNNPSDGRQPNHAAGMAMTRENSQDPDTNEVNDSAIANPMHSLFEVTKLRNLRSNPRAHESRLPTSIEDDFISTGHVSLVDAEKLFDYFNRSLNHYLWGGIALVHSDLNSVRRSSSLLLTSILTVSALHVPGMENVFDVCYGEFVSLVCASMLDRYHNLDGIRALAIGETLYLHHEHRRLTDLGAFWLSDLSWKLSGHAVRIATELNLHQSFAKAMKGSSDHFASARLWYFLYVCDHHFSIAYGRPPVIHEDYSIVQHEKFLQLPQIEQMDLRLHSQVSIFSILTEMYFSFGPDIDLQLTEEDLHRIRHFNLRLDTWRVHWEKQLAPNPYIASYPAKGVSLHYHYGKLQLNALAIRGYLPVASYEISTERRECLSIAITCAETILRMVLEEPDIRNGLVGVPLYLHTMVTFGATFLLKVHQKWKRHQLGIDLGNIQNLVERVIDLLRQAKASERHLTYHIANGLGKMLDKFMAWEKHNIAQSNSQLQIPQQLDPTAGAPAFTPVAYDLNYANMGLYNDVTQLYDSTYFPEGFFDVLSSAMPE